MTALPHDAPPQLKPNPGHIPALDGVRGLAILLVMFFHFTVLWKDSKIDAAYGAATRFGWVGVDLFFVLSGYLITGILLDNKNRKNFFRNFFARRVLRIFPLYYIVVFLGTVILPMLALSQTANFQPINHGPWQFPFGYTSNMPHWPFYWLYFANFPIVFTGDNQNDLIAITWSLAIEEQFYMFWPFVVFFCTPSKLKKVCIGVLSFSLLTRIAVALYINQYGNADENHRIAYEFTLCRLDAISLGALLATMMRTGGINSVKRIIPRTRWLAAMSIIIILGCFAYQKKTIFNEGGPGQTIGYTAIAVMFFCLLSWVITSPATGLFNRFFSRRWLIFLGTYSYAIYLCHMPIHRYMREFVYKPADFLMWHNSKMPGQIIFYVLCTVPTLIIALLSWNLIEKHVLRLKKYFPTHHPPEITTTPAGVSQAQSSPAA